jgi:hypothetical protein
VGLSCVESVFGYRQPPTRNQLKWEQNDIICIRIKTAQSKHRVQLNALLFKYLLLTRNGALDWTCRRFTAFMRIVSIFLALLVLNHPTKTILWLWPAGIWRRVLRKQYYDCGLPGYDAVSVRKQYYDCGLLAYDAVSVRKQYYDCGLPGYDAVSVRKQYYDCGLPGYDAVYVRKQPSWHNISICPPLWAWVAQAV